MIYLNKANESWVVDRFRDEWYEYNSTISTKNIRKANILWIIAPWTWRKINKKHLKNKIVICTIHHIDTDKFDEKQKLEFRERDEFVNIYHAISDKTAKQVSELTKKPIETIPFWVNQNIWFDIPDKESLRNKYNLNKKDYIVGSFQRDTEGSDLLSPKLSKGPDQLIRILNEINTKDKNLNLHVILAGKRRQYIIDQLKINEIQFTYFEMINFKLLNELYNCLDLYIVSSRIEGGPQSVVECAQAKVPIVSTDVGNASNILHKKSIYNIENFKDAEPNVTYAYSKVQDLLIPKGFRNYLGLIKNLV
tara:strand:- start:358 stop:1278 length:921 start_codon:yes stop_codon:yes gene_type:complete